MTALAKSVDSNGRWAFCFIGKSVTIKGLGKNLFLSAKRLEPDLMMSSLLLSILLGGGLFLLIYIFEKRYLKF